MEFFLKARFLTTQFMYYNSLQMSQQIAVSSMASLKIRDLDLFVETQFP